MPILIILQVRATMKEVNNSKRSGNISPEQKELLIAFIAQNDNLRNKKFTSSFTYKDAQNKWQEITNELNSIPGGSQKSSIKWRKTWQDLRTSVKQKVAKEKRHAMGTGGGQNIQLLNNRDAAVLDILSKVAVEGDPEKYFYTKNF